MFDNSRTKGEMAGTVFATLLLFEYHRTRMASRGVNSFEGGFVKERNVLSFMEVLHALADPVRLEIVRQLDAEGEKACGMFGIDMPKSSLSHHFRILRSSGVIASENHGTAIMNRLRRKDLDARFPGLLKAILKGSKS
jgi:DNA-binding transcriptional ArsR family regulator